MLIVPLHRAPTRANFPWITAALIVVNAFVFFALQSGDGPALDRALSYYADHDLGRQEFPAYERWLEQHPQGAKQRAWSAVPVGDDGKRVRVELMESDAAFLADLHAGTVIGDDADDHDEWASHRAEFDRLWDEVFTERWMLRFSELDPRRIFGAMFLHGGIGHLFGNMLFLALLGLLVEGALGHALFLVIYLAGGFGSALASLAWHWGDAGSALGASGAIASLMGAYCVLWGRRKVRFFWWFFVVFDYVKAPALVLLPFWLGWELVNLFFNKGAHVGFDAHAGGIVVGALLALGVRSLGWERRDFLDEERIADEKADDNAAIARANEHIGRLEIGAARALLEPIAERMPNDLRVLTALYRCARYEPRMPRIDAAARAVLTRPSRVPSEVREQKAVYEDYLKARGGEPPLTPAQQIALASRWLAIGEGADAARLIERLVVRDPSVPGIRGACLALARELRSRGDATSARTLLERVVAAWPESPDADKARLLLTEVA